MNTNGVAETSNINVVSKRAAKKERRKEKSHNKPEYTKPPGQQVPQPSGLPESTVVTKSKAELKAERRAKQDADRAAKASKKTELTSGGNKAKGHQVSANILADDPKAQKKAAKRLEKQQVPRRTEGQKKVALFSHLHQYERSISITKDTRFSTAGIHPAIIRLGLQYAEGIITGSNARSTALINALCCMIEDYVTPPQTELSRHLDSKLKPAISFLSQCRPLSVSMGNAIKYSKAKISRIPNDMSDSEAKKSLIDDLQNFIHVNINLARKQISNFACTKISDGDVVMVYGSSSLINYILNDAYTQGRDFRVVVVDSRPKLSGLSALRRFCRAGIKCTYVIISAVSYIMPEVTKVLLGAHALLSNGYVTGSVGTSLVAMAAKARGVPVMVCCEAYKFYERVQTDAFVNNEIGDPRDLLVAGHNDVETESTLARNGAYNNLESLKILNLTYDVTPPDYIAMVVTELGMIPCTSVPVVLRVRSLDT